MATLPIWMTAKHISSVVLTPQTVSPAGVRGARTPVATVTARLLTLDDQSEPQHDEINPITSGRLNNVIIADGWRIRVETLLTAINTDPDLLMTQIYSFDFFKLVYVIGTVASGIRTKTVYGVRGTKGLTTNGRSALRSSLDLLCVDVGATDFVVYAAS